MGCGLLFGALLVGFSSCEMKNELWGKDPNELSPNESGILDLKLEIKGPTYNNIDTTETRAASSEFVIPNTSDLDMKIFDESGELYEWFDSYTDYEKLSEYMLKAGTYYVEISSGENYEVTTDHPYYATRDTVQVKVKEVATVNAICELQSAILYLIPSDEFLNACLDDYSITITNGAGVISIRKDDSKIVYVRPGMKATVTIRATEKNTNTPVIRTFVLAGEDGNIHEQDLFKVEIKDLEEDVIPNDPIRPDPTPEPTPDPDPTPDPEPEEPETNGGFTIQVDVTVNENPIDIVVPSTGGNGGNIGDDTTGDDTGNDGGNDGITITGDAINSPLVVEAPNKIETFIVRIDSDVLTPDELETVGLVPEFDLANTGDLATSIGSLGFPVNIKGETNVSLSIAQQFVDLLKGMGGTTKFHLTITDSKGNTQTKTITVTT